MSYERPEYEVYVTSDEEELYQNFKDHIADMTPKQKVKFENVSRKREPVHIYRGKAYTVTNLSKELVKIKEAREIADRLNNESTLIHLHEPVISIMPASETGLFVDYYIRESISTSLGIKFHDFITKRGHSK